MYYLTSPNEQQALRCRLLIEADSLHGKPEAPASRIELAADEYPRRSKLRPIFRLLSMPLTHFDDPHVDSIVAARTVTDCDSLAVIRHADLAPICELLTLRPHRR